MSFSPLRITIVFIIIYFYLVFYSGSSPAIPSTFFQIHLKKGLIAYDRHFFCSSIPHLITNPIELGDTADDKEFILDINVLLDSHAVINLEMQMAYQDDWEERSLSYLCRSFDQLSRGARYGDVKPTIHIGFLNFSPGKNTTPEFYASYRLLNEKTHDSYSDKFLLRVVNLKQIDLATEEDKASRIDYWARLFTATSWEDMKMIAHNDSFLSAASQPIYESNADEIVRQKCRAREDYCRLERSLQEFAEENEALQQKLAEKDSIIQALQEELARARK